MKYYVYGCDLVDGLVGPFNTWEAANDHINWCYARGDADPGRVVDEAEADRLRPVGTEITPEEDMRLIL